MTDVQFKLPEGEDWAEQVGTLSEALAIAGTLPSSSLSPVSVTSESAVISDPQLIIPDNVLLTAPAVSVAVLTSGYSVEMGANSLIDVYRLFNIDNSVDSGAVIMDDVNGCTVRAEQILGFTCFYNTGTSYDNTVDADAALFNEYGIRNNGTGTGIFDANVNIIRATFGEGFAVYQDSTTCPMTVLASRIDDDGSTDVTGVYCKQGELDVNVFTMDCDTAIETEGGYLTFRGGHVEGDIIIGAGSIATVEITDFDHDLYSVTVNGDGVLNGRIGSVRYGTWKITDDDVINIENWEQAKEHLAPAESSKAYQVFGTIIADDDTSLDLNGATLYGNVGRSFDGFESSVTNHKLFNTTKTGVVKGLKFDINGTGAQVFDVNSATGFDTWTISDCSFNGNTNLGSFEDLYALQEQDNIYQSNAGGYTITDVANYANNNSPWIQNNTATTNTTFVGEFSIIRFHGGGMGVASGKTGMDFSGVTSITSLGQIDGGFAFTGDGDYVDDVDTFEERHWTVEAVGIPLVYKDSDAYGMIAGDTLFDIGITVKDQFEDVDGTSTLASGMRFSQSSNGVLQCDTGHSKVRMLNFRASVDPDQSNRVWDLRFVKNGSTVIETTTVRLSGSGEAEFTFAYPVLMEDGDTFKAQMANTVSSSSMDIFNYSLWTTN